MTADPLTTLEDEITACRLCPRLVAWREQTAAEKRRAYRDQEYWGKPVPGFGDPKARILVVGLAPGAHGSNRTGRMFTGDASGEFLYRALYECGFASKPSSEHRADDLTLKDLFITAVCRCVPPDNKPTPQEIRTCMPYLEREAALLAIEGIVALGKIAFDQILRMPGVSVSADEPAPVFAHGAFSPRTPTHPWILSSYHPSRQNTQTGRLTAEMFQRIWQMAREQLG
jgi:uracil-DNA glycosylase family 4